MASNPTLEDFLSSDISSTQETIDSIETMEYLDTVDCVEDQWKLIPITLINDEIDPRLLNLSHSSRTTLHKCPRKYQLDRLSSKEVPLETLAQVGQNVTFAYGHAVGIGIQSVLEAKTEDQILMDVFLGWDTDLLDRNDKQKKSFWSAVFATQRFAAIADGELLNEYELVYYTSKSGEYLPAVELSFLITLPNGFKYRGFLDAVLKHKVSGEVLVLECKTSSSAANSATFKNSGQAVGYSVVLDILFPSLSSYTVLYLVYETKSYEFVQLPFRKSLLQRALWLQELLIDAQMVELYASYGIYPMHGEACFDFFRECEYLGLCTLKTENIVKPLNALILERIEKANAAYEFVIDFHDLVDSQIAKGEEL